MNVNPTAPLMSEEAWLAALAEAAQATPQAGDAGVTTTEICAATSLPVRVVHLALRRLLAAGRLAVGRGRRTDISGRVQQVAVYRLIHVPGDTHEQPQ